MADNKQIEILKKGVNDWNEWRYEDLSKKIDLSNSRLSNSKFQEIFLSGIHPLGKRVSKSEFSLVNMSGADLSGADLARADFSRADLSGANLSGANLSDSNLSGAKLTKSNLSKAKLTRSKLRGANLSQVNFFEADLYRGFFKNANLYKSDFTKANLVQVNFVNSNLMETNLYHADLRQGVLLNSNLTGSNITGVKLYGSSRDDWKINRVKCDYVYLDKGGEIRTPKDRDFKPGEFEELYKKVYEIEHIFENGFSPLDAVLMNQIIQIINKKHPEFELKLDSLHSRGQPRAVFTVLHKDYAEVALQEIKFDYEKRIAVLEADRDRLERCFNKAIDQPKTVIGELEMSDNYIIKGQTGAVGPGAKAEGNVFNQIWNEKAEDIDLKKLSEELSILRKKLKEDDDPESDLVISHVVAAEIEANKGNGPKVLEHLKNAGQWTFNAATQIGCAFVAEIMKKHLL